MWYFFYVALRFGITTTVMAAHPGWTGGLETPPIQRLTKPIDLAIEGHHAQAMAQAKRLMAALKANNWSPMGIPKSLARLPDQDFDPWQKNRTQESISFGMGGPNGFEYAPYKGEIAFFSGLYVSRVKRDANGKVGMKQQPHGFYIVGYRNGEVKKVDVKDARYVHSGLAKNALAYVFPGMSAYKTAFKTSEGAFRSTLPSSQK